MFNIDTVYYIMNIIYEILRESWNIYLEVSIYMLFGFFFAAILFVFLKTDKIKKYLGQGRVKPVILAALFGIPIPLCSCGVVPVAISLKKQGANNGAALSFMIATPESGIDSIAISFAMLGPVLTFIRTFAGFLTAISTGIVQNFFTPIDNEKSVDANKKNLILSCENKKPFKSEKFMAKFFAGIKYAYMDLLQDIAKPFVVGILIAGCISFFLPDDIVLLANKHHIISIFLMLIAGIPMYVCATSSTPIAAALILKGLNPGAAIVFLIAGPATNAATINIIKHEFGKKTLLIYLIMIVLCSVFIALFVDWFYSYQNIFLQITSTKALFFFPTKIQFTAACLLFILIIFNFAIAAKR